MRYDVIGGAALNSSLFGRVPLTPCASSSL